MSMEYPETEYHMDTDNLHKFKEAFLKGISEMFDTAVCDNLQKIKEEKEHKNLIDKELCTEMTNKAIGQYYDLETIVKNSNLNYISMNPHDLKSIRLKKVSKAKLVNVNGWETGQAHFVTDDGHYLLIPWCYIVSMIPSKDDDKK